jgi:hypothetical protein
MEEIKRRNWTNQELTNKITEQEIIILQIGSDLEETKRELKAIRKYINSTREY